MSVQTYSAPSNSQVNKIWRKIQGDVADALQFECEEWSLLDRLDESGLAWSLREVIVPLDITEGGRVSQIPEGGYETIPFTPNVEEITVTPVQYNIRFAASFLAQYVDQRGGDAMIENELKFRAKKSVQSLARAVSDDFYGFSTSILALTDTDISGTTVTVTLSAGYGVSGISNTTFIADKFRVSDRVAILDAGTYRVTGQVSSITSAGVMVLVLDAAFTTTTNSLQIVRANAVESTQTSYNRGLVGLLDVLTSASVFGLSSTSIANWSPAFADTTTGGRFSGTKLQIMRDQIHNYGGGKPDMCFIAQGVKRDLDLLERSALRQTDPMNLVVDGNAKAKGMKWHSSRRVPPGYVAPVDMTGWKKWQLNPKPGTNFSWRDGYKPTDQNFLLFGGDLPLQLIPTNRKKFAYLSNQQEQNA